MIKHASSKIVVAALLIAALACSRSVTSFGGAGPLTGDPAFATVAPREQLTLQAKGGAGGNHFAFAQGGQQSGSDATLDATSGRYQAGSVPLAEDQIALTDAAGAMATLRISVGPALTLTPVTAAVAPAGTATFTVSGGKPPYLFQLGAGSASDASIVGTGATGLYQAGLGGGGADLVSVSDATNDAKAIATARVSVGPKLALIAVGSTTPFPFESVSFVASGGQPPYLFSLATPSSGGSIGATTGVYVAGASGPGTDTVTVTDSNGQSQSQVVTVGASLIAALTLPSVVPFVPNPIAHQGGIGPYHFAFAKNGNRSQGSIDAVNGIYTPGPTPGAIDLLTVTDATGLDSNSFQTTVGNWQVVVTPAGGVPRRCLAGDLDGDGLGEGILGSEVNAPTSFEAPQGGQAVISDVAFGLNGPPEIKHNYIPTPSGGYSVFDALVKDMNGDQHDDIVFVDSYTVRFLLADLSARSRLPAVSPSRPTPSTKRSCWLSPTLRLAPRPPRRSLAAFSLRPIPPAEVTAVGHRAAFSARTGCRASPLPAVRPVSIQPRHPSPPASSPATSTATVKRTSPG